MKYLIVGRTGTGKTTLAQKLASQGLTILKSYTTRPKRYEGEDTYIFISPDDVDKYPDKVATTKINGYNYFATRQQVQNSDIYIIDPNGLYELLRNMPEEQFYIVYITPQDEETRMKFAINRADDPEKEKEIYKKRCESEDAQFTEFEKRIMGTEPIAKNAGMLYTFANNFNEACIKLHASHLWYYKLLHDHLTEITYELINEGLINTSDGLITVQYGNADEPEIDLIDPEAFTVELLSNDQAFAAHMKSWLASHNPKEVNPLLDLGERVSCDNETCAYHFEKFCKLPLVTGKIPSMEGDICDDYITNAKQNPNEKTPLN